MSNSYRQDAIANNLANSETTGFKRDVTRFQQRLTAAQEMRNRQSWTDPRLEKMSGGLLALPNSIDFAQGEIEPTGNSLDAAIEGKGFFVVDDHGTQRLTRAGHFQTDQKGQLVLSGAEHIAVLSADRSPIKLQPFGTINIQADGIIAQDNVPVARLAVVDAPQVEELKKQGGNLFDYPKIDSLKQSDAQIRGGFAERANVDPAIELTHLIDAQRQLEANANLIRFQDQMLARLVTDVGKI